MRRVPLLLLALALAATPAVYAAQKKTVKHAKAKPKKTAPKVDYVG
jgi:hypothetical protein